MAMSVSALQDTQGDRLGVGDEDYPGASTHLCPLAAGLGRLLGLLSLGAQDLWLHTM